MSRKFTDETPNKKVFDERIGLYSAFHRNVTDEIRSYNTQLKEKFTLPEQSSEGLEKLISGEKISLVKAFVNNSGKIEKEYSKIQKSYLCLLKKFNKKAHTNKKESLDKKIIEKYANKKLEVLKEIAEQARKFSNATSEKRDFYLDKYFDLNKDYNEEVRVSEKFSKLEKECDAHIEELTEKVKTSYVNTDLMNLRITAVKDHHGLNKCFRLANYRANAIRERMKIIYSQYIQTDLYAETLTEQALSLSVAYEFYTNLYGDLKTARAIKLQEFMDWNKKMDTFLGDYNKEVDSSAKHITELFSSYKERGDLLRGEDVLERNRKSIQEMHENLLENLKLAREEIINLEI